MHPRTVTVFLAATAFVATALFIALGEKSTVGASQPDPRERADVSMSTSACRVDEASAESRAGLESGELTASLSHSALVAGAANERYAVIDFDTEPALHDERPPLDVAILIDRSGSMGGAPIRQARKAALGVLEHLGPEDRVSVATYDNHAEAVVPPTAVTAEHTSRISQSIRNIGPRGMTNIHGGLSLAYDQLREGGREESLSRLIHLSDGQANQGTTSTAEMVALARSGAAEGFRTTSVGLGVDYNEALMESLADAGRGGYYFVDQPSDLKGVFAGELEKLQATVATNAELKIEPRCEGVRVGDVLGVPTEREGDALVVSLADVAGGESRRFVVALEAKGLEAGARGLITAEMSYEDANTGEMLSKKIGLATEVSPDPDTAAASVAEPVMAQVLEVKGAQAVHQAAAAYREGRYEEASQRLEAQGEAIDKDAERYDLSDDASRGAQERVQTFDQELKAAPQGSRSGKAAALDGAAKARKSTRAPSTSD